MFKKTLKIGLLCDESLDISQARSLFSQGNEFQICALLVQTKTKKTVSFKSLLSFVARRGILVFFRYSLFSMIQRCEGLIAKIMSLDVIENDASVNFERSLVKKCPTLFLDTIKSKNGLVYRFSDYDCSKVDGLGLDVIIRCGSGILKGRILECAVHGIWSFHHGDNRWNRGGPPGFWECYLRKSSTGVILQRLDENLDGGRVIIRGNFPTQISGYLNRRHVIQRSSFLLRNALVYLHNFGYTPLDNSVVIVSEEIFRYPKVSIQIAYIFKTTAVLLNFLIRKIRSIEYTWNLYFYYGDWVNINLTKPNYTIDGESGYRADPFLIEHQGRQLCFYEYFPFETKKGVINALSIGDTVEDLGTVLEEKFHLSFPFVFNHEGSTYLLPESHESNDLTLYRVDIESHSEIKISPVSVLLSGVRCADPLIFYRDERWWLLVNIDSSGSDEFCSELHCFSSVELFSGLWESHPLNPLIIDSATARNGGFIFDGTDFFRVFQKQGFNMYGRGFGIAKIVEINLENYSEKSIYEMSRPVNGLDGIHTFNHSNGLTVCDGAKRVRVGKYH